MIAINSFLRVNNLKQVELAKFLEVSKGYISRVCAGDTNLSDEKFTKLIQNSRGWDVSMLVDQQGSHIEVNRGVQIHGDNTNSSFDIDNRQYYSDSPDVLRSQIDLLESRITMLEEATDRLSAQIKEKDAQIKEKDAQIKEKDAQIKEKDAQIKEKDAQIKTLLEIVAAKA